MSDKLLPCPFCNEEPIPFNSMVDGPICAVACRNSSCPVRPMAYGIAMDGAAKNWNGERRPTPKSDAGLVEVRKAIEALFKEFEQHGTKPTYEQSSFSKEWHYSPVAVGVSTKIYFMFKKALASLPGKEGGGA